MKGALFSLGGRLKLCASMVREGAALADIGTDHGYLPIWLSLKERISRGIAADVRQGPLAAAEANIRKWKVKNVITRLSDGLTKIAPEEADDIVTAGMGGELIARIIGAAPWLKGGSKRLILQPMTSFAELREFLAREGFAILEEKAVLEGNRAYTVILAEYAPEKVHVYPGYAYIGGLVGSSPAERIYLKERAASLHKQAMGFRCEKNIEAAEQTEEIRSLILQKLSEYEI